MQINLSLVAKQTGQLKITGVAFEWSYLSPHQPSSDQINGISFNPSLDSNFSNQSHNTIAQSSMTTVGDPSFDSVGLNTSQYPIMSAERHSVKGKICLFENKSSENSTTTTNCVKNYIPILQWLVTAPAPSLRVSLSRLYRVDSSFDFLSNGLCRCIFMIF